MKNYFPNVAPVAQTPRQLPDSWSDLVEEDHPLARLGCWAQVAGGLLTLLGVVAMVASVGAWWMMGWSLLLVAAFFLLTCVPVGVIFLGVVMRLLVKKKALANGRERLKQTPLAMAAVVQANDVLYDEEEAQMAPAVLVWANGGSLQHDAQGIQGVAQRLRALRDQPSSDPVRAELGEQLADLDSNFVNQALPESVVGAPNVFWTVTYVTPSTVGGALPKHGVLPVLLDKAGFKTIVPASAW